MLSASIGVRLNHRASRMRDWIADKRVLADFGPGDSAARRRRYRRFVMGASKRGQALGQTRYGSLSTATACSS